MTFFDLVKPILKKWAEQDGLGKTKEEWQKAIYEYFGENIEIKEKDK